MRWPALALLLVLGGCSGGDGPPLPLAPHVDLARMYGGWYIVANIPNWFEDKLVGLYDVYSPRPDGDIREDFYTHQGGFDTPIKHYTVHDWVTPGTNNAGWRVQIFWPLNFPFLILYVDPDYNYVLFGYPDRSLGWIFSRAVTIDDATYAALLRRFQALGYDVAKFRRVVELPEQVGQPGFGGAAGAKPPPQPPPT
jgi:apolipoprotein D and lipocalin family protein